MRALVLLALCACGRVAFDPTSALTDGALASDAFDAASLCATPLGHDEDADGVDDNCDTCPHMPVAQTDRDDDGVGDMCDPEPLAARQRIVRFDPFIAVDSAWIPQHTGTASSTVAGDQLRMLGNGGSVSWRLPYNTAGIEVFIAGARLTNPSANTHLFGLLAVEPAATSLFYCELFTIDTSYALKYTYQINAGGFVSPDTATLAMPIADGSGTLTFRFDPTTIDCVTNWRGAVSTAQGPRPAGIAPTDIRLYAETADVTVDYFLHIGSQ